MGGDVIHGEIWMSRQRRDIGGEKRKEKWKVLFSWRWNPNKKGLEATGAWFL